MAKLTGAEEEDRTQVGCNSKYRQQVKPITSCTQKVSNVKVLEHMGHFIIHHHHLWTQ